MSEQTQQTNDEGDSSDANNNDKYHRVSSNDAERIGNYSRNVYSRGDFKEEGLSSRQRTKRQNWTTASPTTKPMITRMNQRYSYLLLAMTMVLCCCRCFGSSMPLDRIFSWTKERSNHEERKESSSTSTSSSNHHNESDDRHHVQTTTTKTTTTRISDGSSKKQHSFLTYEESMKLFEEIVQVPIQFANEEEETLSKVRVTNDKLHHFLLPRNDILSNFVLHSNLHISHFSLSVALSLSLSITLSACMCVCACACASNPIEIGGSINRK